MKYSVTPHFICYYCLRLLYWYCNIEQLARSSFYYKICFDQSTITLHNFFFPSMVLVLLHWFTEMLTKLGKH